MAKKNIQKVQQIVNVHVGDKGRKRKPRRRRAAPKKTKKETIVQHTFTTPIINYPPYQNPATVQPVYQHAGPRILEPPPRPSIAVHPEGETLAQLGLTPDQVPLQFVGSPELYGQGFESVPEEWNYSVEKPKGKRGRKKGSKNRPKYPVEEALAAPAELATQGGLEREREAAPEQPEQPEQPTFL